MDHPPGVPEFIRTGAATLSLIVTALLSHRRRHGAASSAYEPAGTGIGARFDAVIGPGAGFLLLFRAAPLRAPDNGPAADRHVGRYPSLPQGSVSG